MIARVILVVLVLFQSGRGGRLWSSHYYDTPLIFNSSYSHDLSARLAAKICTLQNPDAPKLTLPKPLQMKASLKSERAQNARPILYVARPLFLPKTGINWMLS